MRKKYDFITNNKLSYIPLKGTTKIAAVEGWSKYSHEVSNFPPEDLVKNNVGIVTGPASDVLVLDIDNPILFASFCKRYHYQTLKNFMVKTGKGYHVYFRYPKDENEYRCKAYPIYGFDIRGVGGYVVAPYSIHEETGKMYEIVSDGEIPKTPEWFLKYCLGVDRSPVPKIDKINSSNIKHLIENGADKGKRSDAIMSVLNFLVAHDFTDDQIFFIFHTYKIGEKFLQKPIDTRDQWLQEQIDRAIEYVGNTQDVQEIPQDKEKIRISYLSGRQLLEKEINVEWLIKGLLEKGGHTLISGKSGMGKSIFTLNLALTLAAAPSKGFLGYIIPRPLKVLIIQCENSEGFMQHRLETLIKSDPRFSDVVDNIEFVYFNDRHDYPHIKLSNDNLDDIIDRINTDKKPDVVILDPYKSYSGVEENSNDKNRDVLDKFFYILGNYGITSIIVHHQGRSYDLHGTDKARGASAITDAISNHWSISRDKDPQTNEDRIVLGCEKCRNSKKFDDIYFKIIDGIYLKYITDPFDPAILADILVEHGGSIEIQKDFVEQIQQKMQVNFLKARDLIKKAIDEKYIIAEKYGQNKIRYTLPFDKEAA